MTTEIDATVGDKIKFGPNSIEEKIKSVVADKNYGESIADWGHIIICSKPEVYKAGFFKEIKKYSKKDKDLDMRLRIDYETMLKANEKEVLNLICKSIFRSIDIVKNEMKIKDFDFAAFRKDLTDLFKKEGWI